MFKKQKNVRDYEFRFVLLCIRVKLQSDMFKKQKNVRDYAWNLNFTCLETFGKTCNKLDNTKTNDQEPLP